ncbi:D-arabinose 5-phosphate isomerase [hydrothermal vent metagenome]|uniref:D-arabinose 5-phosphate isomerase n=1 Tax=hydrothermal vent metagenome TaxID=652676 RepID=A0A3B0VJB9_9ZZZZ
MKNSKNEILKLARQVVNVEKNALNKLQIQLGDDFVRAIEILLKCKGHVIVIGMGKSGHIGNKMSATLASTGTPAFSVHPGEASHGDLGMITKNDVTICVSNSGETAEVLNIIPIIKRMGILTIAITGNPKSTMANIADVHLSIAVGEEACPLGLAPTTSTTTTLVLGDALAVTLLKLRGFTEEDFARSHPAGTLGKKLLLRIDDLMRTGDDIPRVVAGTNIEEALFEITKKRLGMTAIVDKDNVVQGIFTDGDLRRAFDNNTDLKNTVIEQAGTLNPVTIQSNKLAVSAAQLMEQYNIHSLLVVNANKQLVGALNIHDLLTAGVV